MSSKMAVKMVVILDFTKNSNLSKKLRKLQMFFASVKKYDTVTFYCFWSRFMCFCFHRKEVKSTHLYSKMA